MNVYRAGDGAVTLELDARESFRMMRGGVRAARLAEKRFLDTHPGYVEAQRLIKEHRDLLGDKLVVVPPRNYWVAA